MSFVEMWMDPELSYRATSVRKTKEISYINTYMWNLKKWRRWTYFLGSDRAADVKNELADTGK